MPCKRCGGAVRQDDIFGLSVAHTDAECIKLLRNRAEYAEMQLAQAQHEQQSARSIIALERLNARVM